MSHSEVQQAISYLCHVDWQHSRLGLERMYELLERLGNPQNRLKYVHIAGTNGKGSTAAMISAILTKAGYRTGLYTSPALYRFNERMQVDSEMISDEMLCMLTTRLRAQAEQMADHPTEFELVTALSFLYFCEMQCDIVVLEVGLGGRMDATNVIPRCEVAVITALGLDHTAILGDTIEQIAAEKAGIIKANCPVVLYPQTGTADQVIADVCAKHNAPLFRSIGETVVSRSDSLDGQVFDYRSYRELHIPLLGAHQLQNAAVAIESARVLLQNGWDRLSETAIRAGLAACVWPGRFEVIGRDPLFIVDGGHNPQCMETVADGLRTYLHGRGITMLVGVLADKDFERMFDLVAPYATRFVTVTPDSPRAMPAEQLARILAHYHLEVTVCASVHEGVAEARRLAGPEGTVCAFGSLYMTGTIRAALGCYSK